MAYNHFHPCSLCKLPLNPLGIKGWLGNPRTKWRLRKKIIEVMDGVSSHVWEHWRVSKFSWCFLPFSCANGRFRGWLGTPRKKIQQWGFQWENHRTRMDFPAASHVWWHRTGGEIPMIFPLFLVNPHMFSHIWPVFYWKILEVHFLLIGMCSKYPQCFSHLYWKLNPSFSDRKTTEETGLFPRGSFVLRGTRVWHASWHRNGVRVVTTEEQEVLKDELIWLPIITQLIILVFIYIHIYIEWYLS